MSGQQSPQVAPTQGLSLAEPDESRSYAVKVPNPHLVGHVIMDEDLDALATVQGSLHQVFLGVALGALLGILVNFWTGSVAEAQEPLYKWLIAGFLVASIYLFLCCLKENTQAQARVKRIRERSAPTS